MGKNAGSVPLLRIQSRVIFTANAIAMIAKIRHRDLDILSTKECKVKVIYGYLYGK